MAINKTLQCTKFSIFFPTFMYSRDYYLPTIGIDELRKFNDNLNAKVVEQVNDAQELVLLNNFARECNECQYKKCSEQRISDIASWRWVLEDLSKRLNEAIDSLQYEHNALRVVIQRVQDEIDEHSKAGSRPGALCPLSDAVEDAIMQEFKFLRDHKNKFEKMIPDLEKEIKALNKTKKRIDTDIHNKTHAISVEECCASINVNSLHVVGRRKIKKKRIAPLIHWENRCAALKAAGLRALFNAAIIRQQVRGARTHLSIAAQAYAARVDSALRRRLHANKITLQDLNWQREEALKDYKSLDEELRGTEQNLLQTMEQERVTEARLVDRGHRPIGELIRDEVDRKLRDELGRIRNFNKQLRTNMNKITSLQNQLADSMTRIDCCAQDLLQVICLDEERLRTRLGESPECNCHYSSPPHPTFPIRSQSAPSRNSSEGLASIKEEDEDTEDYLPI